MRGVSYHIEHSAIVVRIKPLFTYKVTELTPPWLKKYTGVLVIVASDVLLPAALVLRNAPIFDVASEMVIGDKITAKPMATEAMMRDRADIHGIVKQLLCFCQLQCCVLYVT